MKQRKKAIIWCVIFVLAAGIVLVAANRLGKQEDKQQNGADEEKTAAAESQEVSIESMDAGRPEMGDDVLTDVQEQNNNNLEDNTNTENNEDIEKSKDMAKEEAGENKGNNGTVKVLNPSWDYYAEDPAETEAKPLEITVLEQRKNEIIDTEKWFMENGLDVPDLNDEGYFCSINRDNATVNVLRNGETEITLDFSDYQYADDFRPEDRDFVEQEIRSAAVSEGILYVSTFHYTYAETSPHNGYITAISLEDGKVLWKTEALTCNSLNFEIIGDVILCGYGFTAEDDYLYQLDKRTGKRIGQIPLVSKADYIIFKDNKLFVRTYHTDYVFQVSSAM